MTVIKEPSFIEGLDVGKAQEGCGIDVVTADGSNHRTEFKNARAERIGG